MAIFVAIVVLLLISLQSTRVQTLLAERAIKTLQKHIDGQVSFEKIHLRPFNAVVIKNLAITDKQPYGELDLPDKDTLFRAGYISATFSLRGLSNKKGLFFSQVRVEDASMLLVSEPVDSLNKTVNLKRMFHLQAHQGREKKDNEIFRINDVGIDGMRFRYVNCCRPPSKWARPDAIDWTDIDVYIDHLEGHGLKMKGPEMEGVVDKLSFKEKSGFEVTDITGRARSGWGGTEIKNVHIDDGVSDIDIPEISMRFYNSRSWKHFTDSVSLYVHVRESDVDMASVGYFVPALRDKKLRTALTAEFDGYVRDFRLNNVEFTTSDGVTGSMKGHFTGLPKARDMNMDLDIEDLDFTTGSLEKFLTGWSGKSTIDIKNMAKARPIRLACGLEGGINNFSFKLTGSTGSGTMNAGGNARNLADKGSDAGISGTVSTDNLDLGNILNSKEFGNCSLQADLNLSLGKGRTSIQADSVCVQSITVHGHEYSGISGKGIYTGDSFQGRIECRDSSLNFVFDGIFGTSHRSDNSIYRFRLDLGRADLHAMNLDRKEKSEISLLANTDFIQTTDGIMLGRINISDLTLGSSSGICNAGDIQVLSYMSGNTNYAELQSGFMEANYSGTSSLASFIRDVKALTIVKDAPALLKTGQKGWSENSYNMSVELHNTMDVLSFLMPGLYIGEGTKINVGIDGQGKLSSTISSGRIAWLNKYAKNISLEVSGGTEALKAELYSNEISFTPILTRNNILKMGAAGNEVGLSYEFDNATEPVTKGKIQLRGLLTRDEEGKLAVNGEVLPSELDFKSESWKIARTPFNVGNSRAAIEELALRSRHQSVVLDGGYSPTLRDTIKLSLDNLDISPLNSFVKNMDIEGFLSGTAILTSPAKDSLGLVLDMRCDSTMAGGENMGKLELLCTRTSGENHYKLLCRNSLDGSRTFDLSVAAKNKFGDAIGELRLSGLKLTYISPLLSSVFRHVDGEIDGVIAFRREAKKTDVQSTGLTLRDGSVCLDFTGVDYGLDGNLDIDNSGIHFTGLTINDRYGSTGRITGSVLWEHFKNMAFDTHISFNGMEVLNLAEGENPSFYGNIFASGRCDVGGTARNILLDINASTDRDGQFHIPTNSSSTSRSASLLTFRKEEKEEVYMDPYDLKMSTYRKTAREPGKLNVNLRANVDQRTEAHIEFDKSSGNSLNGRGNGIIDVQVNPSSNFFSLNGDYTISSGNFHLDVLGIAQRDFAIKDGSTVKFNGDLMESNLDITAEYRTKASIATLISDSTAVSRRAVKCIIHVSNRLKSPLVSFDINIPDLDPSTQTLVDNALSTDDKVQKQFLSLLVSNSFMPDEQSGVVNNSTMLNSAISEIMAGQLNSILQKFNIPLDLGFGYQNSNGSDSYDVSMSTEFFNSRIIVNGSIGNRQYGTESSTAEFVGDLDIEIKLDKKGALRLKLFSHSADQYTNYLDNSQRNGAGISYQLEFNKFGNIFKSIFKSRARRKAEDQARELELQTAKRIKVSIENE